MSEAKTKNRYLILGSGIAGMAAAEAIRAADDAAQIVMVSAEWELCPNRPMLIEDFAPDGSGAALFEKQQDWPGRYHVDVRLGTIAEAIDLAAKTVTLRPRSEAAQTVTEEDGSQAPGSARGEARPDAVQVLSYDKLIYALGAQVTIPPIPGADRPCVHVVRTREDMKQIRAWIRQLQERTAAETRQAGQTEVLGQAIGSAVVIGGGMLGLEDAWALRQQRLAVSVIEQQQRVAFGQIDQSAGNLMKKRIERFGVPVYVNAQVEEIGDGYVTFRQPAAGEAAEDGCQGCCCGQAAMERVTIPAELVILSTGVTPESGLGAAAGLATTGRQERSGAGREHEAAEKGASGDPAQAGPRWIAVDAQCRTSDPHVFAAGDCAAVNGRNDAIWEEARQMGRVAGVNAVSDAPALRTYTPVTAEHVFTGFDTEVYTLADSSGAGTDGVYIRHADVEIFDYQRERYIRVSLQNGRIAGVLLINASELAPALTEAYHAGAGEEEARRIVKDWIDSHEVDFKPAAPFRKR